MAATDEQLMDRARQGDTSAFGVLFDRHQPRLVAFLTRFLGDAAAAEDVAQESFWRAWENRTRYDPARPFITWLYGIARHAAINETKKPYRRAHAFSGLETAERERLAEQRAPDADRPDRLAGQRAVRDQVREALLSLPDDQRLCLILREYEGCSYREAAEILGCTEGAARVLAHRARQALRKRLAPLLESEDCCVG